MSLLLLAASITTLATAFFIRPSQSSRIFHASAEHNESNDIFDELTKISTNLKILTTTATIDSTAKNLRSEMSLRDKGIETNLEKIRDEMKVINTNIESKYEKLRDEANSRATEQRGDMKLLETKFDSSATEQRGNMKLLETKFDSSAKELRDLVNSNAKEQRGNINGIFSIASIAFIGVVASLLPFAPKSN